jgi:hypothetical protein
MMPLISTALALFSLGAPIREVRPVQPGYQQVNCEVRDYRTQREREFRRMRARWEAQRRLRERERYERDRW